MTDGTILVPLDASEQAEGALLYAGAIAKATGAALRLLTVITRYDRWPVAASLHEDTERAYRANMEAYLEAMAEKAQSWELSATTVLVTGDPAEEILHAGAVQDVTLTVMGTAGRGGAERLLVGSVADKVMRLSHRPVLLLRSRTPVLLTKLPKLERLLVPLDGSALAESALPLAGELAKALGARVTLARIESLPPAWPPGATPDLQGIDSLIIDAARDYLRDVARRLPPSVPSETVARWGPAAAELLKLVEEQHIDLVVMTTHGRGGLRRLVLGSTADRLVREGVPTLLVPPTQVHAQPGAGP